MKKGPPAKKPAAPAKSTAKPAAAKAPAKAAAPKKAAAPVKQEEEKKVEEPSPVVEAIPEPEPPKEPVLGKVVVLFNHYNESFPICDGVLKWFDIDEEYCFSSVYETGFFLSMYPEGNKESLLEIKGHTFLGCVDGSTYVVEAREAAPGEPGAFVEGVEEQEEVKEEEEVDLPIVGDDDPAFSPQHPKNMKYVHEIIVHPENESTKDFKDLLTPQTFTQLFDKQQKLMKHFRKPELDYTSGKPNDKLYLNTYRNGFVSAVAMAYNYHLPLTLCPNDIWLVVLNGFKIHMRKNADKEYMKLSFDKLKDLDQTIQKHLKIEDASIKDLQAMDPEKFETLLLSTVSSSFDKVWNQGHRSVDFAPDQEGQKAAPNVCPLSALSDIFQIDASTSFDVDRAQRKGITMSEKDKAQEKVSAHTKKFYKAMFGLSTFARPPVAGSDTKDKQHCGITKVRFLGTLKDWHILKRKIIYLDRYGCHKWLDVLLPVINKFIEAIETDTVDKAFWDAIYSVVPAPHQGQKHKVHGWVCNFFPYAGLEMKEQFAIQSNMKKLFRERGKQYKTFMMDEDEFAPGENIVPIVINKKTYSLVSGILGVEFRHEVINPKFPDEFWQFVKPAIGWAIYQEDASLKHKGPSVFVAAETAGPMF